jgi:hypothetical protein
MIYRLQRIEMSCSCSGFVVRQNLVAQVIRGEAN